MTADAGIKENCFCMTSDFNMQKLVKFSKNILVMTLKVIPFLCMTENSISVMQQSQSDANYFLLLHKWCAQ
jgi:hypothetical protein